MSKKSRSSRIKNRTTEATRNQDIKKTNISTASLVRKADRQSNGVSVSATMPVSHEYVKSDLMQVGIIAAVLIIIMIILAFIPGFNA